MSMSQQVDHLDGLTSNAGISLIFLSVLKNLQGMLTSKNLFESFPTGRLATISFPLNVIYKRCTNVHERSLHQQVQLRE